MMRSRSHRCLTIRAFPCSMLVCTAAISAVLTSLGGCAKEKPESAPSMPAQTVAPVSEPVKQPTPAPVAPQAVAQRSLDERGLPVGYEFKPDREITPRETKKLLDEKTDFVLIDCRTPEEVATTKIEGSKLIPLQQLEQHDAELAQWKGKKVVVYCRSGNRSTKFVDALKQKGFVDAKSMVGGIVLWNEDVTVSGPKN